MRCLFSDLYRRIGIGLGWFKGDVSAVVSKPLQNRTADQIRIALDAAKRLERHARDMRKSGVTEKMVIGWINEGRP